MARHRLDGLDALLHRSVEDPEWFYPAFLETIGWQWYNAPEKTVDFSRGVQWPRWFPGASANLVHNALDRRAAGPDSMRTALIWEGEDGETRNLTYGELARDVNRLANGLRTLGIGRGDRVGLFLPMIPETAAALFACAKIGAILIPLFSGYGAESAADRLRNCGAKCLITADGFYRRGRVIPMKETADDAAGLSPTVEKVIVIPRLGRRAPWQEGRDVNYRDLVAGQPDTYEPVSGGGASEAMDPDDPFMIIYTSGTTGAPKGAVHTHTGFPVKSTLDMFFAFDVGPDDTVFWFTDIGWMMGPWLIIGSALSGAAMVLYEGTPDYPEPDRLWRLVERHRPTVFGLAPTAVRALMARGDGWVEGRDLTSIRILGSTGEPWNPEPWQWYADKVGGGRCPIINYSGGTEISGGIVGCYPIRPLMPGSFHGPIPGIAADVVDDEGNPVRGSVGELVIRAPWLGMTKGFWKDDERYLETYWNRWPGIWYHGDWSLIDEDGLWYILGRSDDTITVAGRRIGPAEIESALSSHEAVAESAAIGVPHPVKGSAITVFAVLRPGREPGPSLAAELRDHAGKNLGRALAPDEILFVTDLPRTRNAKIVRRLVKAAYLGETPGDTTGLENPRSLKEISALARRRTR